MLDPVSEPATLVSGQLVQPNQLVQPLGPDYLAKTVFTTEPVLSAPTITFQPVLNPSLSVESLVGPDIENLAVEPVNVQFNRKEKALINSRLKDLIEEVSMFKCQLCGFLSTTADGI